MDRPKQLISTSCSYSTMIFRYDMWQQIAHDEQQYVEHMNTHMLALYLFTAYIITVVMAVILYFQ